MSAARQNLLVDAGSTFDLTVQYENPDGTPIDLTGYEASFKTYKAGATGSTALFTKAAGVDDQGNITVKATDEETALWPLFKQAYTLEVTNPDGDTYRLLFGAFTVRGLDV